MVKFAAGRKAWRVTRSLSCNNTVLRLVLAMSALPRSTYQQYANFTAMLARKWTLNAREKSRGNRLRLQMRFLCSPVHVLESTQHRCLEK
jgi:hypothetical protein